MSEPVAGQTADSGANRFLWPVVGGAVVLVQAAVLALIAIPAPHTGGDHTAYLALGHALAEGMGYIELWDPEWPVHTKYPPGFPMVLALLMLLGATTWSAFKLSSAVAVSAATLLAFAWAARRVGPLAAGALAVLLVLAGGWQDASRWILSEPWFLVWTFLALWAGERGLEEPETTSGPSRADAVWLAVGGLSALMAFGVRSAGIPLVLAFGLALLWAGRRRAAAVFGGATALVVGGWMLHTARGGEGAYQDEFWLVDPYDPELGTVTAFGLLGRIWDNLVLYVGRVLPGEWWPAAPAWLLAVGGLVAAGLALWGWLSAVRSRPGPAELFLPLYAGMILLWPQVWSGDRFFLPLLPLVLLYAGTVAVGVAREVERRLQWDGGLLPGLVLAAGVVALAGPAIPATLQKAEIAGTCRTQVEITGDAFSCHGAGFAEFRAAASWMAVGLPDDAVLLSRKPRIAYALGAPPGRTFPFVRDPDEFLARADEVGARYLLVDRVDAVAGRYLPGVLEGRPRAFCYVGGWGGGPGEPGTDLVGILPPDERRAGGDLSDIQRCPPEWTRELEAEPVPEGLRVPLLVRGAR